MQQTAGCLHAEDAPAACTKRLQATTIRAKRIRPTKSGRRTISYVGRCRRCAPVKQDKRGSCTCDKSFDAKSFKSRAKTMARILFVPILSSSHRVRATLIKVSRDARLLAHTYPSAISSVGLFSVLGWVAICRHFQPRAVPRLTCPSVGFEHM